MLPEAKKILIVKLSSLGDVVLATGAIRAIRKLYPKADIRLATERCYEAVVQHCPHLTGFIFREAGDANNIAFLKEKIGRVFPDIDLAIDLHGNQRSSPWVYASLAKFKCGLARGPRLHWQHPFQRNFEVHIIEELQLFFESLGMKEDLSPEIFLAPRRRLIAEEYIILNPFTSRVCKTWPLDCFADLAHRLKEKFEYKLVLTGAPNELPLVTPSLHKFPAGTLNLVGKLSLEESLHVWKDARFMISADSGPKHAAAAFGTKVLALYGATHFRRVFPWGQNSSYIQERFPPYPQFEVEEKTDEWMRAIPVSKVLDRVSQMLSSLG